MAYCLLSLHFTTTSKLHSIVWPRLMYLYFEFPPIPMIRSFHRRFMVSSIDVLSLITKLKVISFCYYQAKNHLGPQIRETRFTKHYYHKPFERLGLPAKGVKFNPCGFIQKSWLDRVLPIFQLPISVYPQESYVIKRESHN